MIEQFLGASPIDRGRQQYEAVMQDGTYAQKEALLIVLRVMSMIRPGPHAAGHVERACEAIRHGMEVGENGS